jgi:hypothetical protein
VPVILFAFAPVLNSLGLITLQDAHPKHFNPEAGGNMFLRNVGMYFYMVSEARGPQCQPTACTSSTLREVQDPIAVNNDLFTRHLMILERRDVQTRVVG